MKKNRILFCTIFLMVFACLSLSGCQKKENLKLPEPEPPAEEEAIEVADEPQDPIEARAAEILSGMTVEQKIGQMFFVTSTGANDIAMMQKYQFGGIMLYRGNFLDSNGKWLTAKRFRKNLNDLCSELDIMPFIGSDEEGGTVVRAGENPNIFPEGRPEFSQKIWKNQGIDALYENALHVNTVLKEIGITVNFSPVADVATDEGAFIYLRSMGADAETTAELIKTVVSAMSKARICSVLKHFPGYGNNGDTHEGVVIDERPYEQFVSEDFLPFIAGIEAGADAVMMNHNIVACMDEEVPASLSPEVHRILREELGFEGLIITDALNMKSVSIENGEDAAALAIKAGNDMIISSSHKKDVFRVEDAIESGEITEKRLDESVLRILKCKLRLNLIE